jgi:hypothetical protein
MIRSTLTRMTTVTDADDFAKRQSALEGREGEAGGMLQVTVWTTDADCRGYLRNGSAAMAATMLDAFFPTAPFPDGNWVRENHDVGAQPVARGAA